MFPSDGVKKKRSQCMKRELSPIICPLFCAVISGFRLPTFLETPFKELFHFYGEHGGSFPSLLSEKKEFYDSVIDTKGLSQGRSRCF